MAATTVNFGPNMNYVVAQWDENNPRYKCCCQNCHVTTGTRIIGILEAIGIGLSFLGAVYTLLFAPEASGYGYSYDFGGHLNKPAAAGQIFWCVIYAVILFCLFWALKTERANLLLPHLIVQVIGMVLIGFMAIAFVVVGFSGTSQGAAAAVTGLIILGLGLGIQIWLFLVVKACYVYFKEKEAYRRTQMSAGFTGVTYPAGQQQVPMNPGQVPPAAYSVPQQPPPYEFKQ